MPLHVSDYPCVSLGVVGITHTQKITIQCTKNKAGVRGALFVYKGEMCGGGGGGRELKVIVVVEKG